MTSSNETTEHDQLQLPARGRLLFRRGLVVFAMGLVVVSVPRVFGGAAPDADLRFWQDVLSVLAVLCVVPLAATAWTSAARPYPHDHRMLALSQDLDAAQRTAVGRALRRGRAVAPEHRDYARAKVAQQRQELVGICTVTVLVWSQLLNASGDGFATGFFWGALVVASVVSAVAAGFVALQSRRERAVAAV